MEELDVITRMQQSRARLRALLVPDPETGRIEADVFPRSAVMRFAMASLPVAAVAAMRSPVVRSLFGMLRLRL